MGDVDCVLTVDPDETEGLEERRHVADRSYIDERRAGSQADFSFPSSCVEEVHVVRVEHAVLAARDVNQDSMRSHISFVARLGRSAHGLVVHRMGWSSGG